MFVRGRALVALGVIAGLFLVSVYAQSLSERIYLPALSDSRPTTTPAAPTASATATATREPTEIPEPTATATVTPSPTPEPPQLVPNGSFEAGRPPWVFTNALRNEGGAQSGQWYASLSTIFGAAIAQPITVPADRPYLVFWQQRLSFSNTCNVTASILVESTTVGTYQGFCKASQSSGWERVVVDLRAFAGRTVPIRFGIPEEFETDPDDPGFSLWYLDNIGFISAP
jgi:hypothetical protein